MRVFNPMMFNVAFKINVVGSARGQVRQVEAEEGIYHVLNTDLYFIYDPNTGIFSSYDIVNQIPGDEQLTEEEARQYTMELVHIEV